MTDIERVRKSLGWSQERMGEYLGVSQATVSNLENGQPLRRPLAKLLDQLEAEIAEGRHSPPPAAPQPERVPA